MPRKPTCTCGECPKCKNREYMRGWYARQTPQKRKEIVAARDKEKIRKRDRIRYSTPEARARLVSNTRRWRKEHPGRSAAHSAVARALRSGKLVKQPCEKCGAKNVHAHHDDYSKPLEVRWLCPLHHAEERKLSDDTDQ